MAKYKKGTQAMLDAAKNDATLLPFNTVFITQRNENSSGSMPNGVCCVRTDQLWDDSFSVGFSCAGQNSTFHAEAADLLPAKKDKKPKQKKWQNGSQEQLDAAKDDARLIPKKTYFRSKSLHEVVYRIDCQWNDEYGVRMFCQYNGTFEFHAAQDLEPINED